MSYMQDILLHGDTDIPNLIDIQDDDDAANQNPDDDAAIGNPLSPGRRRWRSEALMLMPSGTLVPVQAGPPVVEPLQPPAEDPEAEQHAVVPAQPPVVEPPPAEDPETEPYQPPAEDLGAEQHADEIVHSPISEQTFQEVISAQPPDVAVPPAQPLADLPSNHVHHPEPIEVPLMPEAVASEPKAAAPKAVPARAAAKAAAAAAAPKAAAPKAAVPKAAAPKAAAPKAAPAGQFSDSLSGFDEPTLYCITCGGQASISKMRLRGKTSGAWECLVCGVKGTSLRRIFGRWPISEFVSLEESEKKDFFNEIADMDINQLRQYVANRFERVETQGRYFEEGGLYLPLNVWATKGFCAASIESKSLPIDVKDHPVLGKTYRVALVGSGQRNYKGSASTSTMNKLALLVLDVNHDLRDCPFRVNSALHVKLLLVHHGHDASRCQPRRSLLSPRRR